MAQLAVASFYKGLPNIFSTPVCRLRVLDTFRMRGTCGTRIMRTYLFHIWRALGIHDKLFDRNKMVCTGPVWCALRIYQSSDSWVKCYANRHFNWNNVWQGSIGVCTVWSHKFLIRIGRATTSMNFYSGADIGTAAGYVLRIPPSLAHSRSLKFPHIKFSGGFYRSFALSIQSKPRPMHETPCLSILHVPVCSSGPLAWEPSESPRKYFSECPKRNKICQRDIAGAGTTSPAIAISMDATKSLRDPKTSR